MAMDPVFRAGYNGACPTPVNPCSAAIQENGMMVVDGLANGTEYTQSVVVTLFDPPVACTRAPLTVSHPITTEFGARDGTHPKRHMGRDYGVQGGIRFTLQRLEQCKKVEVRLRHLRRGRRPRPKLILLPHAGQRR